MMTNAAKWKIVLPSGAWYEVDAGDVCVENFFSKVPGGGALRLSGMAITAHIAQPFTPYGDAEGSSSSFNGVLYPAAE